MLNRGSTESQRTVRHVFIARLCNTQITLNRFSGIFFGVVILFGCHDDTNNKKAKESYIIPKCATIHGPTSEIRGDLIHEISSARKISDIIIDEFYEHEDKSSFDGVNIQDGGQTWKVQQILKKGIYGGYVTFEIDKCTGGVRNFTLFPD